MTSSAANGLAVIWDVDGTLVDTAELHFRAWEEMGKRLQRPFTRADFAATFGRRNPEILLQLFPTRFSEQEIAELGAQKEVLYRAAAQQQGVALLPGVQNLLERLHAAGFRQAIGSSAPRENVNLILRLTQVEPFFDAVASMEDTQRGKPDPQVFLVSADKLGALPSKCLVLEDAPSGVEAARAGGMKCIGVNFVGHHSTDKLAAAGADRVVQTLEVTPGWWNSFSPPRCALVDAAIDTPRRNDENGTILLAATIPTEQVPTMSVADMPGWFSRALSTACLAAADEPYVIPAHAAIIGLGSLQAAVAPAVECWLRP